MKKTISAISALFMALVLLTLTACSAQLSEQEYADKIMPAYKTYVSKLVEAATMKFTEGSQEEITAVLDEASAALDEIEQLNPPAIYSAQHQSICEAMQYAREEIAINKRIAEEGESDELLELLEAAASETDFHDKMLTLAKHLRDDGYYSW